MAVAKGFSVIFIGKQTKISPFWHQSDAFLSDLWSYLCSSAVSYAKAPFFLLSVILLKCVVRVNECGVCTAVLILSRNQLININFVCLQ